MATVSGVWVFNETLNFSSILIGDLETYYLYVNFTSKGETYTKIRIQQKFGPSQKSMYYESTAESVLVYSYSANAFIDDGYRTIDFGPNSQTVNDRLYTFLIANAAQQAASVPTPDWANCFVKTASGNKAVEKVWIKQNGQLKVVWQPSAPAPVSFVTDSWETISAACKDGSYKTVYQVGDTKDITLSTGETITVAIMGFDHDDLSDGSGKAPITVAMENLLATKHRMNASEPNAGGWDESEMRTSTMATLRSQLPSDLQSVIKQVNKKATAGSRSESITTSADKLWLFSLSEIYAATSIENSKTSSIKNYADAYKAEGTQYKYYENLIGDNNGGTASNSLLTKKLSNGDGSVSMWWVRSPSVGDVSYFKYISLIGAAGSSKSDDPLGVSFGFCVG